MTMDYAGLENNGTFCEGAERAGYLGPVTITCNVASVGSAA